ncbi:YfjI family protein [Cupriavidus sp. 30B13]|uniref:YfjI family protein n=1 Tax=Cupriavidus sp. 30B13 TaxID=3384241 RepID=UPI003B8EF058
MNQAFPVMALPPLIRNAVLNAQSKTQAPMGLAALSALSAVSVVCQDLADVRRMQGLESPCSLYMLGFGVSGERKTQLDKYLMKAIRESDDRMEVDRDERERRHNARMEGWSIKKNVLREEYRKAVKQGKQTEGLEKRLEGLEVEKPVKPLSLRLLYSDATPEAIAFGLYENWPAAGIVSDEAGAILNGRAASGLAMLNKLWDGASLSVDRRSSESFTVHNARLTISLMVQPGIFEQFMHAHGDAAREIGFFARFLVAYPESTQGTRYLLDTSESDVGINFSSGIEDFGVRVEELLHQNRSNINRGCQGRPVVELSVEAQKIWRDYYNNLESEILPWGVLYSVKEAAAKMAENVARMAALFHIFERSSGFISSENVNRAINICNWFGGEFIAVFVDQKASREKLDAEVLERWIRQRVIASGHAMGPGIRKNEILQSGPLRHQKLRIEQALDYLVRNQKIRFGSYSARSPKMVYLNNPPPYIPKV